MPESTNRAGPAVAMPIDRIGVRGLEAVDDVVAVEEPLAIRVAAGDERRHLAVTMRTPGDDAELAVGWLHAEGVLRDRADVVDISWCARDLGRQDHNAVTVTMRGPRLPDLSSLQRTGAVTSACGVCGKTTIDGMVSPSVDRPRPPLTVTPGTLMALPERLRAAQRTFRSTGGLHAAGLFTADGSLLGLREDVGRHNALDKLVGAALLDGELPWHDRLLLLSGRASFELLQKAVMAGVRVVCSVGAPSSLAVDVARRFDVTLVGFLRATGANVYAGAHRVTAVAAVPVAP